MDEAQIAQQQKQNIPQPTEHVMAAPVVGETGFGNAKIELDELTQYKLHDFMGLPYKPNDEISRQQMQYIYEKVSDMSENKDYPYVVAKMRELMRIAGITHSENRRYKLYQWLKLESIMKRTQKEMENLSNV